MPFHVSERKRSHLAPHNRLNFGGLVDLAARDTVDASVIAEPAASKLMRVALDPVLERAAKF